MKKNKLVSILAGVMAVLMVLSLVTGALFTLLG